MALTLTPKAADRVRHFISRRGKGIGLRVGVATSGCSGMAYRIEFADSHDGEDRLFESCGVTLIVDERSLPYIDGTELDFVKEGLNEGFRFNNPNAANTCGCGESFSV